MSTLNKKLAAIDSFINADATLHAQKSSLIAELKKYVAHTDLIPKSKDEAGHTNWLAVRDAVFAAHAVRFQGFTADEWATLKGAKKLDAESLLIRRNATIKANSYLATLRKALEPAADKARRESRDFKTRTLEAIANMTKSIRKEELANESEIIAALTVVEKLIAKI